LGALRENDLVFEDHLDERALSESKKIAGANAAEYDRKVRERSEIEEPCALGSGREQVGPLGHDFGPQRVRLWFARSGDLVEVWGAQQDDDRQDFFGSDGSESPVKTLADSLRRRTGVRR